MFVQTLNIAKGFRYRCYHSFIQVLTALAGFINSHLNKIVYARVVDVVLKPGQVEAAQTKAHQVQKRLYVVDRVGSLIYLIFSYRRKHRVSFEGCYGVVAFYALGAGEVNQKVFAIVVADVVQFQIPMAEAHLVQLFQGLQQLLSHFGNFNFQRVRGSSLAAPHKIEPLFIQVLATVTQHEQPFLALDIVSKAEKLWQELGCAIRRKLEFAKDLQLFFKGLALLQQVKFLQHSFALVLD